MPKQLKRYNRLVDSGQPIMKRVCLSVPMTGLLRSEWVLARYGQTLPVNWSNGEIIQWFDSFSPLNFSVADARNVAVDYAVREKFEWLLFIDHDVVLPPGTFIRFNEYINDGSLPVVSGLYNAKGYPPEPLLFRGRGNSWFRDWKLGEKVWVDGVPMGCTLISGRLLKLMHEASEEYTTPSGNKARRVFHTPREAWWIQDQANLSFSAIGGTEDLWWCDRVLNEGFLDKIGYKRKGLQMKYPFLVDTRIKCGHIDMNGQVY